MNIFAISTGQSLGWAYMPSLDHAECGRIKLLTYNGAQFRHRSEVWAELMPFFSVCDIDKLAVVHTDSNQAWKRAQLITIRQIWGDTTPIEWVRHQELLAWGLGEDWHSDSRLLAKAQYMTEQAVKSPKEAEALIACYWVKVGARKAA